MDKIDESGTWIFPTVISSHIDPWDSDSQSFQYLQFSHGKKEKKTNCDVSVWNLGYLNSWISTHNAHTKFAYDKDKGIGTSLREMEGWVLVQERRCKCCEIGIDGDFMWELCSWGILNMELNANFITMSPKIPIDMDLKRL